MDSQPARLSKTLPKDFTFNPDGEPRTPERPTEEVNVPPIPNHASCRFRRPQLDVLSTFDPKPMTFGSPDVALPSIEVPEEQGVAQSTLLPGHDSSDVPQVDNHLQVPRRERMEFHTPPAQIRDLTTSGSYPADEAGNDNAAAAISRPSSACSNMSNSSISSCESYLSRPSFGGSCTSPESEIQDPFVVHQAPKKEDLLAPPQPDAPCEASFDAHTDSPRWTSDMDNHLWNTYQTYLQNPTITPFKTVPGSLPPLGVSHRVAREARKTWPRARRAPPSSMKEGKPRRAPLRRRDVTPANNQSSPVVAAGGRSGSTTPTAGSPSSKKEKKKTRAWPRSNASTRRRLKELCKRKFSMAPHYQRLLQSRSPSPFVGGRASSQAVPSSRAMPSSSSRDHAASFTRDLGVSLVATSLPTSVRGSSVSAEANPIDTFHSNQGNAPNETAQSILPSIEFTQHHDSQASSSNSNNALLEEQPNNMRRLGSPFVYHTWGPDKLHRRRHPSAPTNYNHTGTMHVTGVRLRSPIPEDMFSGSHKRRALSQAQDDNEDPSGDAGFGHDLPDLLSDGNKNAVHRRIRLRNRGATTGAISSRERLLQLFTPPSQMGSGADANTSGNSLAEANNNNNNNSGAPTMQARDTKRLGSPFCLNGHSLHAPSRSESFAANSQYEQLGQGFHPTSQHENGENSSMNRSAPFH